MSDSLNRRSFCARSLIMGSGALASSIYSSAGFAREKTALYYDQYYNGALKILNGLHDTQTELIENEMKTAYLRTKKGGTIYSQITSGHFPIPETALDRIGQPGVFAFLPRGAKEEDYQKLDANDMILTNTINLNNIEARKRGIRVVAATVNYYPFAATPPEEGYQIEHEGKLLKIEDTADVTIDSQMPWHNGLIHSPKNPEYAILPSSGFAHATLYWMAAAELAGVIAAKGKGESAGLAEKYVNLCIERSKMAGSDRPKLASAAKTIANYIQSGGRWFVYGANHAIPSDAVGVANGPMVTRYYKDGEVRKGDVVLIGAYSSNNSEELAVAREARKKGALTIAITPFSTDGDSSGDRLYKEVDIAFNNYSPESWGVIKVPGLDRKVCPTTGVISDLLLWLLVAQWTQEMENRGQFPYFWKGFFMKNGRGYNDKIRPYFIKRGW